MIFALSLPVVIGGAGLGVDVAYWHLSQRRLQTIADLAANAGAIALRGGADSNGVRQAAQQEVIENGFELASGTIVVNTPPQSGAFMEARAVEVLLERSLERFFTGLFLDEPVVAGARAVARYEVEQQACVLALDSWAGGAVSFSGSADATFTNCTVMSNSLADDSVDISGNVDVTAHCLAAAGKTSISGSGSLSLTCSEPLEDMPQAPDPYDDLPEPPIPAGCSTVPGGNPNIPKVLNPGRYCGGMSLSGTVTLNPGVYVVDGGSLQINGNATVSGTGVTFFLTNGATVSFNGNAEITLAAPTSGVYAGVLMYGDRDQGDATHTFNGTANSLLTGALYFPTQTVRHLGNFSGVNGCLRIVSRRIQITGDAGFGTNCTGTGLGEIEVPSAIRLVE